VQFLSEVTKKGAKLLEENSSVLLTAGGVIGTITTGVLAGRGGFKAARIIDEAKEEMANDLNRRHDGSEIEKIVFAKDVSLPTSEMAKILAPHIIPPVLTGSLTIGAIIFAHRLNAQKITALVAAYGLADKRLDEYKAKVSEHLTGPKKEKLETEIAQDRVNTTPGHDRVIIVEGDGDVLCFDEPTGRYFKSSPEKIKRAVNATNAEILRHGGAPASYFYDELELPPTSWSNELGWSRGEQVELAFNYVRDPNERPCLSIDFKKMPSEEWNTDYH